MDYYTELDAVSMGGILNYPENGDLEYLSIPMVTHTSSGYVYDNNEPSDPDILSDIRVPSIASNVSVSFVCYLVIYLLCFDYDWINNVEFSDTFVHEFRSIYKTY